MIGRFFNVVGPRQTGAYGMVLPRLVDAALAGGPLVVHDDGQQARCFADVADVVAAVIALMETPAALGRVFNVGSDQPVTILDLAQRVAAAVDPRLQIVFQSYADAYSADFEDVRSRVPDLTRLRSTIDFQLRHDLGRDHSGCDRVSRDVGRDVMTPLVSSGHNFAGGSFARLARFPVPQQWTTPRDALRLCSPPFHQNATIITPEGNNETNRPTMLSRRRHPALRKLMAVAINAMAVPRKGAQHIATLKNAKKRGTTGPDGVTAVSSLSTSSSAAPALDRRTETRSRPQQHLPQRQYL